jgi:hypothetical protein
VEFYRTPDVAETLATAWMGKDMIYIFIAVPLMYVLARDLVKIKRTKEGVN